MRELSEIDKEHERRRRAILESSPWGVLPGLLALASAEKKCREALKINFASGNGIHPNDGSPYCEAKGSCPGAQICGVG